MRSPKHPLLVWGLVLATLLTINFLPQLASVLLLIFAGTVLAVILDAPVTRLAARMPGGRAPAYALVLLCVIVMLGGTLLFVAPHVAQEIPQLMQRLPHAWNELIGQLNEFAFMRTVTDKAENPITWFSHSVKLADLLSSTFGALFNVFVICFVGLYGAAVPERYLHLATYVFPAGKLSKLDELTTELATNLRFWILGRAASMAIVGIATGVGLWFLGVPLAFTLGLIAGLLSFVPYIGPILGLIPALLIAAVQSLALAGWMLVLYSGIQLVESVLLTPLIQQRAISMPPVILISVQLIGGVLVGPLGVLFAAPLVVVTAAYLSWNQRTSAAVSST